MVEYLFFSLKEKNILHFSNYDMTLENETIMT